MKYAKFSWFILLDLKLIANLSFNFSVNKQWKGPADDISLRPLRGAAGQARADGATASKNMIVPHSGRGEDTLWCTH